MLRHLLGFELGQLLKNGVFWIVVAVYALMGFGTMASDNVSIGGGVGNTMRNAPAVIISILGSFSVISVLLATIFVAGIAIRDFEQRTAELFFATPMKKRDYLLGRFGGGLIATAAIMLAMAIGLYVGSLMPWLDSSRLGPTPWSAYAWSFVVLVLPNLLFVSSLMFLLATLTRSMLYTYLGVIVFFVLWSMSDSFTRDLDTRWVGALVDPSGANAVADHIRYWSSAQLNHQLPALTGLLLANRALWICIAYVMLLAAFGLFRADREGIVLRRRKASQAAAEAEENVRGAPREPVLLRSDWRAQWRQYLHQSWFDLRNTVRGAPFIVMVV
ncbi:MAG: ABC transporter permease, partial [Luteimonas sp.]|nr:ABC transporter permease [Luteimonas sp.]